MGRIRRNKIQIKQDIENQNKICSVCKKRKSFSNFYNFKNKSDGKSYRCKLCDDKARSLWRKNNPERYKKSARERSIKHRYGITYEDYMSLLKKQENKCAICEGHQQGKDFFSIDHDHNTGKIRGLLCNNCNRGLGLLKDSSSILENAINYLRRL